MRCKSPRALFSRLILLSAVFALSACGLRAHGSLAVGEQYAAKGQYRAAYIEAKKVLQHDDKNGAAWLLLGKVSLMLGNPNDALNDIKNAQTYGVAASQWAVPMGRVLLVLQKYHTLLDTVSADQAVTQDDKEQILALRGNAYLGLKNMDSAKQAFDSILAHDSASAPALIGLAKIAATNHDLHAAEQYVQQALTASPQDANAWVMKGDLAFGAQDFAAAVTAYSRAVGLKDSHQLPQEQFYALARLADSETQLNDLDQALGHIETLEKMSPEQPYPHYLHAVVFYKQGHMNEAVSQLQQVLKVLPNNEPAQMLLGAVNYAQGNLGQAEMFLSNVIGMDQNNAAARKLLAMTLYRQGQSRQALDTLRPAVPEKLSDTALLAVLQREVAEGPAAVGEGGAQETSQPGPVEAQFARANAAEAQGNVAEAIRLLKEMPAGSASFESTRYSMMVMAYLRDKKPEQAVKVAAEYAGKDPTNPKAHLIYGMALVANGKHPQARAQYLQASHLDPKNVAALMSLGSLDGLEGHYQRAQKRYESALKLAPKNPFVLTALGRVAALRGDNSGAILRFKQAIQADPKLGAPYTELTMLYSARGQFEEALNTAKAFAAASPANPAALNALGAASLNSGQYKDALKPLEAAVKADPKEPLYRINLARAQILNHDSKAAQANLTEVVRAEPGQISAVALLAFLKLQQGDMEDALSLAKMLRQQKATEDAGWSLEGDLYMAKSEYPKAANAYRHALASNYSRPMVVKTFAAASMMGAADSTSILQTWLDKHPEDSSVRMLLGEYYMNHADYEKSVAQYQKVLANYPANVAVLNNVAWDYTKLNSPKALSYAERAYKLAPNVAGIQDTYGWALVMGGRAKTALPVLAKAARQAASNLDIQYHLAVAQARTGDASAAKATLEAALRQRGNFASREAAIKLYRELGGTAPADPGA